MDLDGREIVQDIEQKADPIEYASRLLDDVGAARPLAVVACWNPSEQLIMAAQITHSTAKVQAADRIISVKKAKR